MVTRDEILDSLAKGATWNTGVTFERTNPIPIEKYYIFGSLADVEAYITSNPVAYPGQKVAVLAADNQTVNIYIINKVGSLSPNEDIKTRYNMIATTAYVDFMISGTKAVSGPHINEIGTPTVSVSIENSKPTFTFDYLKGEKGDPGHQGAGVRVDLEGGTLVITNNIPPEQ